MNVIYTTSNSFSSLPKGINIASESTRVSEFPISYIELRFIIKNPSLPRSRATKAMFLNNMKYIILWLRNYRLTLPTVLCISTNMGQLCLRVYKRRLVRRLNKLHQLEPFTFTSSELVCGHLTEASTKTVFENEQNIRVASQRARPKNAGTVSRTERCVSSFAKKVCSKSFGFI